MSAAIAGLAPASTYDYRVVAGNATGTSVGANATLVTAPATVILPASPLDRGQLAFTSSQGPRGPTPEVTLAAGTATSRGGLLAVRLRCPSTITRCAGALLISETIVGPVRHGRRPREVLELASGGFTLPGGSTATVHLRLRSGARALLARVRVLHTHVTIITREASGASRTAHAALTVRANG